MMTLETGVPGAGKTLYCVDKLIRSMVGSTVRVTGDDGAAIDVPRTIYTNINGLLIDHQLIEAGPAWQLDAKSKAWVQGDGNKLGLNNWHEWAKPGAIIVYDEVQKVWPNVPAGSPIPPCIEALQTHRHMGVDFIVLTQHPNLINSAVRDLIGRHLHIRRMGNMGLAIVYEWDTCSRSLIYKNALAKSPYRYDKSVFQLYKSADAHTKQPRRIPSLVFGILFAVAAMAFLGPTVVARVSERINPPKVAPAPAKAPGAPASAPAVPKVPVQGAMASGFAPTPARSPFAPPAAPERLLGCIAMADRCECFDEAGVRVESPAAQCRESSHRVGSLRLVGGGTPSLESRAVHPRAADAGPSLPSGAGNQSGPIPPISSPDAAAPGGLAGDGRPARAQPAP